MRPGLLAVAEFTRLKDESMVRDPSGASYNAMNNVVTTVVGSVGGTAAVGVQVHGVVIRVTSLQLAAGAPVPFPGTRHSRTPCNILQLMGH